MKEIDLETSIDAKPLSLCTTCEKPVLANREGVAQAIKTPQRGYICSECVFSKIEITIHCSMLHHLAANANYKKTTEYKIKLANDIYDFLMESNT